MHLKEAAAASSGGPSIETFGRHWTSYKVCDEYAMKLAGGDEELAESILNGHVLLHEIPRQLLRTDAIVARQAWLREERDRFKASIPEPPADIFDEIAKSARAGGNRHLRPVEIAT